MKMMSFKEFFDEEYLALESIKFIDRVLIKPIYDRKPEANLVTEARNGDNDDSNDEENADNADADNADDENNDSAAEVEAPTGKKYLQNAEQVKLVAQYQKDPNSPEGQNALVKLIENSRDWIRSIIHRKFPTAQYADQQNMESDAVFAMIDAIKKFDVNSKTIFNGYMRPIINGTILNRMNKQRSQNAEDRLETVNVDQKIGNGSGEWADKERNVGDTIPDNNQSDPWEDKERERAEAIATLHEWYETLPEDEKIAMKMYFTSDPDEKQATYQQIGDKIGMTKAGVEHLIKRIIRNFRQKAEEEGLGHADKAPTGYKQEWDDWVIRTALGKKRK